ncbi:YkvI family membrane protein [Hyphococcus sp.]|jgi:uncharacterized membrane protein YkvI|uniref:YkvI family membrane protein n=1 Tax=Hyphococcus sp. TaxID=2038636 RepID=UPI003D123A82
MSRLFRTYLLPGLVFQSVIIGGGYGTGREIVEFFMSHGALGGLFGLAVTAVAWAVVFAVAFEFARICKAYNYRAFFMALLGPFWRLFEVLFLLIALLVLSVLGSAAGEMLATSLGAPQIAGVMCLLGAIGALAFFGGPTIERALAWWSLLLYAVYAVFLVWVSVAHGDAIISALQRGEVTGYWFLDGVRYAAYNLLAFVAVLFVLPYLQTRNEALISGSLAGLLGILPGVFVFLAMLAQYPEIQHEAVPVLSLLEALNSAWFFVVFQIVLFGTFVETGVGLIHAVNERIAASFADSGGAFPQWARFALAVVMLCIAIFLARAVGIISLIAKGYGLLSYGFIALVIAPLLTIGLVKIINTKSTYAEDASESG